MLVNHISIEINSITQSTHDGPIEIMFYTKSTKIITFIQTIF